MAYWMAKASEIARVNVVHFHNASSQADPCWSSTLFFPEPHQNEIIPQRTVQCTVVSTLCVPPRYLEKQVISLLHTLVSLSMECLSDALHKATRPGPQWVTFAMSLALLSCGQRGHPAREGCPQQHTSCPSGVRDFLLLARHWGEIKTAQLSHHMASLFDLFQAKY